FRKPEFEYLVQVAKAADRAGFLGALIPTGSYCEDAWLVAAAITQHTERLKALMAFRPGFVLPALAAQTAASFQKLTGERLLLNVVTGGNSREQRGFGDFLDHDARYERTAEFLEVVRGVWRGPGFTYEGRHYHVDQGGLVEPLRTAPTLY